MFDCCCDSRWTANEAGTTPLDLKGFRDGGLRRCLACQETGAALFLHLFIYLLTYFSACELTAPAGGQLTSNRRVKSTMRLAERFIRSRF